MNHVPTFLTFETLQPIRSLLPLPPFDHLCPVVSPLWQNKREPGQHAQVLQSFPPLLPTLIWTNYITVPCFQIIFNWSFPHQNSKPCIKMSLVWEIHRFTAVRICTTDDCKWTNSVINCFYIFKKAVYAGNNMISPSPCLFYWESFVANVVYILSIRVFCINMVGAQILWMKSEKSGTLTLSANIVFHFQQRRMEPAVHIYYFGTFPSF